MLRNAAAPGRAGRGLGNDALSEQEKLVSRNPNRQQIASPTPEAQSSAHSDAGAAIVVDPSDEAHAFVRRMRHEALAEFLELWTSLGVSASHSAFRGDMLETAVHLRQARDVMRETFSVFRELEPNLAVAILDRNGKKEAGEPNLTQKRRRLHHER